MNLEDLMLMEAMRRSMAESSSSAPAATENVPPNSGTEDWEPIPPELLLPSNAQPSPTMDHSPAVDPSVDPSQQLPVPSLQPPLDDAQDPNISMTTDDSNTPLAVLCERIQRRDSVAGPESETLDGEEYTLSNASSVTRGDEAGPVTSSDRHSLMDSSHGQEQGGLEDKVPARQSSIKEPVAES